MFLLGVLFESLRAFAHLSYVSSLGLAVVLVEGLMARSTQMLGRVPDTKIFYRPSFLFAWFRDIGPTNRRRYRDISRHRDTFLPLLYVPFQLLVIVSIVGPRPHRPRISYYCRFVARSAIGWRTETWCGSVIVSSRGRNSAPSPTVRRCARLGPQPHSPS